MARGEQTPRDLASRGLPPLSRPAPVEQIPVEPTPVEQTLLEPTRREALLPRRRPTATRAYARIAHAIPGRSSVAASAMPREVLATLAGGNIGSRRSWRLGAGRAQSAPGPALKRHGVDDSRRQRRRRRHRLQIVADPALLDLPVPAGDRPHRQWARRRASMLTRVVRVGRLYGSVVLCRSRRSRRRLLGRYRAL